MSQAEIFHLRIEAFGELKRLYGDVINGRYDNTNTRQRLEVVQALHEACCRELDQGVSCPSSFPRKELLNEAITLLNGFIMLKTGDASMLQSLRKFLERFIAEGVKNG